MRLLVCISEDFYFLSHRRSLLLGLKARGVDVHLATRLAERTREVLETGIPTYHVDLRRESLSPLSVLQVARRYSQLRQALAPDVILAVALKPIISAALSIACHRSQRIVCAFAGLGIAFSAGPQRLSVRLARLGMELLFRPLLRRPNCYCLFQNASDEEMFRQRGWSMPDRTAVIPGAGVDLHNHGRKRWDLSRPIRFLFAGRLLRDKGVYQLVDACRLLRQQGIPFVCQIAGLIDLTNPNHVPESYMLDQARSGIVEWLGPRSDLPDLMADADCFVFPTLYREGVPKVLLEAAASGLPMVVTDMPGCRDVVTPEQTGLLVRPDDPTDLARAMAYCANNRKQLMIWGERARARAQAEFGVESVIKRHLEILGKVAGVGGSMSVLDGKVVLPNMK